MRVTILMRDAAVLIQTSQTLGSSTLPPVEACIPPTGAFSLLLSSQSGRDFVEIVERILERYPPHAAKAGVCAHFMDVTLMKSQCAQPQTTPRKRGSHAIQDAETVEQRAQRTDVLF